MTGKETNKVSNETHCEVKTLLNKAGLNIQLGVKRSRNAHNHQLSYESQLLAIVKVRTEEEWVVFLKTLHLN